MGIPVHLVGEGIDWPAWVQAIGSLVALGIAIYLPNRDRWLRQKELNERRLVVSTADAEVPTAPGMKIRISYDPELRHQGYEVRLFLPAGSAAVLLIGSRDGREHMVGGQVAQQSLFLPLTRLRSDLTDGPVFALAYCMATMANLDHWQEKGVATELSIEIWSTAQKVRIVRKTFWLSPLG